LWSIDVEDDDMAGSVSELTETWPCAEPADASPLVSVVMIFMNGMPFMTEAIQSVFAQTYQHWELILVDDGSVDDSTQVALAWSRRFPERVRYVEHEGHENRGMSASRNLGIKLSRGECIAFLDSDDVYLPQKLERQVALLAACPRAAMVYGATIHWHSWTGRPDDQARDCPRRLGTPPNTLVEPPALIPLFLRLEAQTPGTCGLLIRRDALLEVGGCEEQFRGMFEDQAWIYKVCLRWPVYVEGGSWDRYRQHPSSHVQVSMRRGLYRSRKPNPAYGMFLTWFERYLLAHGPVGDPALVAALADERYPYRHPLRLRLRSAAGRVWSTVNRMRSRTLQRPYARDVS
jgi:glycosyltransferase involved in cell wall biosynthesis